MRGLTLVEDMWTTLSDRLSSLINTNYFRMHCKREPGSAVKMEIKKEANKIIIIKKTLAYF